MQPAAFAAIVFRLLYSSFQRCGARASGRNRELLAKAIQLAGLALRVAIHRALSRATCLNPSGSRLSSDTPMMRQSGNESCAGQVKTGREALFSWRDRRWRPPVRQSGEKRGPTPEAIFPTPRTLRNDVPRIT